MIGTIARVVRNEGVASAWRRAADRGADAIHVAVLRTRGLRAASRTPIAILNVAASGTALRSRLAEERLLRDIALLQPGLLTMFTSRSHARAMPATFDDSVREALSTTSATAVHFEGMNDVPLDAALRLARSGMPIILGLHDLSLFNGRWQDVDTPAAALVARRAIARDLLMAARAVIVPSHSLLEEHRRLFAIPHLDGSVIQPGVRPVSASTSTSTVGTRNAIAFAGSVTRSKGAHLLPEFAGLIGDTKLHVFGGGDGDLLAALRRAPNVIVHGYYRGGHLPTLLQRHGIGLVVLPSIVPEAFSLVLSEAWVAGAAVASFDIGAQAERIRRYGGGWLTPLANGAGGLAVIANDWNARRINKDIPTGMASPLDSAARHIDFYRALGLL